MSVSTISCCGSCNTKCAVCGASGATHGGVYACAKCRSSKKFGLKCPVCHQTMHNNTMAKCCSKCSSKHKCNTCDFCGGK